MRHEELKKGMFVLWFPLESKVKHSPVKHPYFVQLDSDPFTTDGRNYYANVEGIKKPISLDWMQPLPAITEQMKPLFIAEVSNRLDKILNGISGLNERMTMGPIWRSPMEDALNSVIAKATDLWSKPAGNEGEWSIGKSGTVVSNSPTKRFGCIDEPEYYGGYLIAESIPSENDARLIAAAPKMLHFIKEVVRLYHNTGLMDSDLIAYFEEIIEKVQPKQKAIPLASEAALNLEEVNPVIADLIKDAPVLDLGYDIEMPPDFKMNPCPNLPPIAYDIPCSGPIMEDLPACKASVRTYGFPARFKVRIYSLEDAELVQGILFKMGYLWNMGGNDVRECCGVQAVIWEDTNRKCLFTYKSLSDFNEDSYPEITIAYFKGILDFKAE